MSVGIGTVPIATSSVGIGTVGIPFGYATLTAKH